MSFFTIFTAVKILAKFETTRKMLNASSLWSFGDCFFLIFKNCLVIFGMFVNVNMCWTILNAAESTDSAAIFIELLKFFLWSSIIFRMHVYVWWRIRDTISGEQEWGLPYPFLKIGKIVLIIWKNALIVYIHRLHVHSCPNSKCYFKSI